MLSCAWPFFIGKISLKMVDYVTQELQAGPGWTFAAQFAMTLWLVAILPGIAYEQIRYWMSKGELWNRLSASNRSKEEK